jgi:hypothetical protein
MDVRAYLQWRVETHQAARERARKVAEKIAYMAVMILMASLWIGAWMIR